MSKIFYENPETKKIYGNLKEIAKDYNICSATVWGRLKKKEIKINKLTEKEIIKRAMLYTRKCA